MAKVSPIEARTRFKQSKVLGLVIMAAPIATWIWILVDPDDAGHVFRYPMSGMPQFVVAVILAGISMAGMRLWKRGIMPRVFCPQCGKYNSDREKWVCGYCTETNTDLEFPFFYCCEHCKEAAAAYTCVHCQSPIFLTTERSVAHIARPFSIASQSGVSNAVTFGKTEPDPHEEKKKQILREIEITQLNLQLEKLKTSSEFKHQVSVIEQLQKSFNEHDAHVMGAELLAKQKRELYSQLLRDDPELLKKSEESIQHWLEKQMVH